MGKWKKHFDVVLQKELKGSFNTFFFEPWEFESDENLSKSLLDFLIKDSKSITEEIFDDLMKTGFNLLEGFARSIALKIPILNISGEKIIEGVSKEDPKSFYLLKEEFKKEFIHWEDKTNGVKVRNTILFFLMI